MKERAEGVLLARCEGTTAVLTINRPEQRNALDAETLHALREIVDEIAGEPALRAVVITGTGSRAFCAGADIRQMQAMTVEEGREWSRLGHDVFARLEALPKPVIAAINGVAVGGGCELALACDFRFMAEGAQLGQPEIKLGMIPGWGGTQRLTRLAGAALTKDLVLTGRLMGAEEAQRTGLVHGLAAAGTVLQQAIVYAGQFASLPPLAVGYAKAAIDDGASLPLADAMRLEIEQFAACFQTDDRREGLAAFLAKRPPQFAGR